MKKIICVSDWVKDTVSAHEFQTALEGYAKDPAAVRLSFVTSTPATIHTGYIVNQLVLTTTRLGRPSETIIFHTTDPRQTFASGAEIAQGAPFYIARLVSDIYVCGPNAGSNYSFIKPQIEELFTYPGVETSSQFRARDLYSRIIAYLADYMEQELQLEETHLSSIPDLAKDEFFIGHIDAFGNIKTTMTLDDLKGKHEEGDVVQVTVGSVTKQALFVGDRFGASPGELVVYPGASGHPENPYLEVSLWRHFDKSDSPTISAMFGNPRPGDPLCIE